MKLGHPADQISYTETTGSTSVYVVALEGRPVMRVLTNMSDPNRRIAITKADGTGFQWTNGVFQTLTEGEQLVEDADGNPVGVVPGVERPAERSVYTYVLPRLHVLIARLLEPIQD